MWKFVSLFCFNLFWVSQAHAGKAHLERFELEFFQKAEILADANSSEHQKEKARIRIERLASLGEVNSFKMLCDFNRHTSKAAFMRDFLACSLQEEAIKNAGRYILQQKRNSPNFLPP